MPVIEPNNHIHIDTSSSQHELDKIEQNCVLSARIALHWQGYDCQFSDWTFFPAINLWRDYLPAEIDMQLAGMARGAQVQQRFGPGELIDERKPELQRSVSRDQFQPPHAGSNPIAPAFGRFYPSDFFHNLAGIYQGNKFPCRITSVSDSRLGVDFNHPLAGKELSLIMHIDSIRKAGAERGGRCNDIPVTLCDKGPGMQDRLEEHETDFSSGTPFARLDEADDSVFFQQARLTPYWDSTALHQVSEYYHTHIAPESHILDLMAGVHSPLQESDTRPASVTAAGLNRQELEHNPVCTTTAIVDVNRIDRLAFEDEAFDVVLIHAAIEYVIRPALLFTEIHRVLTPGGKAIISFSNRSVTEKTIHLWSEAHEFERPGIVLSWLRSTPGLGQFASYSMRGRLRRQADELAHQLLYSDPVYIIQAIKK